MSSTNLLVGFGRRDLTPDYPVPLAGYGNTRKRMHQGWYNRIYATCIAITDEKEQTFLLFTVDTVRCVQSWTNAVRQRIFEQTGIPAEHVMLCGTHTHSGPDIGAALDEESQFFGDYVDTLTAAAMDALSDRVSTKAAAVGKTQVPGLTFVRHYYLENNAVVGDNFGNSKGHQIVGYTMPADEQMQMVRLIRDGKPDVLLVNWQAHPTVASNSVTESGRLLRPFLGSDYVGSCRDYVEAQTGMLFAFFQGASGNLNSRSRIAADMPTTDYRTYGQQVGRHVVDALNNMAEAYVGSLQTRQQIYVGKLDHTEDGMVETARRIYEEWTRTNDLAATKKMGEPFGIHSPYHAGAIIRRSKAGTERSVEINAIALGDVAFITAPYEMFCNSGQFIKEHSPYDTTFICTSSNDVANYIASSQAFDHGCYEVDNRTFVRGTAEELADAYVQMLKEMK